MVPLLPVITFIWYYLMNTMNKENEEKEEYKIEENEKIKRLDEIRDAIILFLYWLIGSVSFIFLIGFIFKAGELILGNQIFPYFSIIISIIGFIVYGIIFLPILKEILHICFNKE